MENTTFRKLIPHRIIISNSGETKIKWEHECEALAYSVEIYLESNKKWITYEKIDDNKITELVILDTSCQYEVYAIIDENQIDNKKKPKISTSTMVKVGATIGVVVVGGGAIIAAPFVLTAVGFTSAGIAAGSAAAGMMSSAAIANGGAIAAGSTVAVLQSVGAAGLGVTGAAAVGGAGAATGGIVGGMGAYFKSKFSKEEDPKFSEKEQ